MTVALAMLARRAHRQLGLESQPRTGQPRQKSGPRNPEYSRRFAMLEIVEGNEKQGLTILERDAHQG